MIPVRLLDGLLSHNISHCTSKERGGVQKVTSPGPVALLCQWRLAFEGGVDGAGELSLEAAEGLAAAFAFGPFALEVSARGLVDAALGDRDPV